MILPQFYCEVLFEGKEVSPAWRLFVTLLLSVDFSLHSFLKLSTEESEKHCKEFF